MSSHTGFRIAICCCGTVLAYSVRREKKTEVMKGGESRWSILWIHSVPLMAVGRTMDPAHPFSAVAMVGYVSVARLVKSMGYGKDLVGSRSLLG
jgi:hypothetical protein